MVHLSFQKVLCSHLELQVQVPAGEAVCLLSLTQLSWVARKQASPSGPGPALPPLPTLLTSTSPWVCGLLSI